MKKILLLALAAVLSSAALYAQKPVRVGIKVGVNYSDPSGVDFSDWSAGGAVRSSPGFTGGAFVTVKLPVVGLFVEAEALYSTFQQRVNMAGYEYKVHSEKVEFPAHVGFTFLKFIQVYAGPSFNYVSSSRVTGGTVEMDDSRHGMRIAGDVGLRGVIKRFSVDFRYQFPISGNRTFLQVDGNRVAFKSIPSLFTLSAGYSFL